MAEGEGLTSSLTLDIADALAKVGDIESALAAATTNIPVTVDTSGVDAAITDAVGAVDPTTTVTGDATEVTGAIDAAVAGADTTTVVTGNAEEVTTAIDSAVTSADTQVNVTADTSEAEAAIGDLSTSAQDATVSLTGTSGAAKEGGDNLKFLEAGAAGAEGSAAGLTSALGPAAAAITLTAGVTAGLFAEATQAIGAEQRLTTAFGEQAAAVQRVNVGNLNADLHTLAQELGSTTSEIDNTVSNLGNFATAAGASQTNAAQFSDTIVALAARSVALNPQLGSVSDAADRLSTVLASGRTRGLVPFNIALSATQIQQEALTETGKTTVTELSRYELAAAGATLATQKYGDQLNQSIAEGSKNPVIQLQALRAEFTNAAEEIGKPLVAPIFETLRAVLPTAVALAQAFAGTAEALLPILNAVLAIVGEIPTPLISMLGTFLALGFAVQGFGAALAAAGIVSQEAFATLAPELAAAAAAFAIVTTILNAQANDAKALQQSIDDTSAALSDNTKTVQENVTALLIQKDTTGELQNLFVESGTSIDAYSAALLKGNDAVANFTDATLAYAEANGKSGLELAALKDGLSKLPAILNAGARETLVTALNTGQLTQSQIDGAEASTKNADGSLNFTAALNSLHGPLLAAQLAQDAKTKADDAGIVAAQAATDLANKQRLALADLGTTAPGVALALAGINTTLGSQVPGLETLAINIGKAKLSNDQIAAIAAGFGVSADALSGFVKNVNDAIDSMNKDAVSKLPAVTDGFDRIVKFAQGIPDAFDPKVLIKAFQDQIGAVQDFENNIAILQNAGLNNLVQLAEKEGPQATAALVKGIAEGGPALGQQLNDTYGQATQQLSDQVPAFFDKVNTQVALQTGLIGKLATDAFGETFRIEAPTETQLQIAYQKAALFGIPFAQALKDTAGAGAVAYEQAIGALPGTTQATIDGVTTTIGGATPGVQTSAAGLGGAINTVVSQGVAPVPAAVSDVIGQVEPTIQGAAEPLRIVANQEGFFIGTNFTAGITAGIIDPTVLGPLEGAARLVTQAAIDSAKSQAGVKSPSTVFADIGAQMGAGLVVGLNSSIAAVSTAAGATLNAAIPNVSKTNVPAGGGITFASGAIVVNLPAGATQQQAFDAGKQVGNGILESIAGRSLAVQVRSL